MMDLVPPDIAAALTRAGLRARAFAEITTLRSTRLRRASYRIELDTGETIKARRFEDETTARRHFEVRQELPDAFVPAFECLGPVLLEQWIEGLPLGRSRPAAALLTEAASLLANLHAIRMVNGETVSGEGSTGAWRLRTDHGLRRLTRAGVLTEQEATRLALALARADPGRAPAGLGHFDFCGENMIIDQAGRLRVFDNERIAVDLLGFDLMRVEYRWGLRQREWSAFKRSYRTAAAVPDPDADIDFWAIVVPIHSACFRLDTDRSQLVVPAARLKRLADRSAKR